MGFFNKIKEKFVGKSAKQNEKYVAGLDRSNVTFSDRINELAARFREINEDYFSTPWSEINWALEKDYDVIYLNSYTLEYKKDAIAKMFDHHMKDITHHQVIYTKKEL